MSRATRKLEHRCRELREQAKTLAGRGRHGEALALLGEALNVAGQLSDAEPASPLPLQLRNDLLRDLSDLHRATGDAEQELSVLNQRGQVCGELAGRHGLDTRLQQTEIEAREGVLYFGQGAGASAVCSMENAIGGYFQLLREAKATKGSPLTADFCQVLIDNAEIMMKYGDPALAGASADSAFRLYLNGYGTPVWDVARYREIVQAASRILVRAGRLDDVIDADLGIVVDARDAARASGSAADRRRLATALAFQGLHLSASAREGSIQEAANCLSQSRALDREATAEAITEWERLRAEDPPVTLPTALATAARVLGHERVSADLPESFTKGLHKQTFRMSLRCDQQDAARYAVELAGVAVDLLPLAAREGLLIGLEAHYLFARGRGRKPIEPDQMREWGIPWMRLILACCRVLATDPEQPSGLPLALDLVSWNLELIDMLLSVISGNSAASDAARSLDRAEIALLLRDCLTQHADLYEASGDHGMAQILRQKAALTDSGR